MPRTDNQEENKGGRPPKFESVEDLEAKIDAYFEDCEKNDKPLTITGLALALDTSRQTLLEYEGEVEGRGQNTKEFVDTIKKAKQMCENYAEAYLYSGRNVAGAIFNLKNNYGWKDKREVEHDVSISRVLDELEED